MSPITTHILDITRGRPARGVFVTLSQLTADGVWVDRGQSRTDQDGRARDLLPDDHALEPGQYRLVFEVASYFERLGFDTFYPEVSVVFLVQEPSQHHHVPLLLSPFGYSTYRGT